MSEEQVSSGAVFEDLRSRAQRAVDAGRLEEAAELIARALAWARDHGTPQQVDHAVCNQAAVAIQLGRGEAHLPRLREILLRSGDPASCRLAAYHISLYYEVTKNFKKSLFYARIARDRAELLGVSDWLAASHNQLGNALLGESFVEDACGEYEQALALMPAERSVGRALILNNLGYCRILQRRFGDGYSLLFASLADLRRFRAERYQVLVQLDLCFAHLETGRYRHARRRGDAALALATRTGQTDAIKNALYLLGEAANLSGEIETARGYFTRLHRDFFPDATYLPGFLLAVDVRKLINLHA
jgi:tetratricopeptide (TPR) repeat protein